MEEYFLSPTDQNTYILLTEVNCLQNLLVKSSVFFNSLCLTTRHFTRYRTFLRRPCIEVVLI